MKKAQKAVRKDTKQKFEQWCEKQGVSPDAKNLLVFFKQNPVYDTLDHEKAKKEGYYLHLLQQARSIIASWSVVVPVKAPGSSLPFKSAALPADATVRLQHSYEIPGKGQVLVKNLTNEDARWLVEDFQMFSENKLKRAYIIAKKHGLEHLLQTRENMRAAFEKAEQAAFASVQD